MYYGVPWLTFTDAGIWIFTTIVAAVTRVVDVRRAAQVAAILRQWVWQGTKSTPRDAMTSRLHRFARRCRRRSAERL